MGLVVRFLLLLLPAAAAPLGPVLYTATPRYEPHAADRFPSGAAIHVLRNGHNTVLAPNFAASADPSVSLDGRSVLFSGKRQPGAKWQIYEVSFAGGVPHQVLKTAGDAITPFYLPFDRIAFSQRTLTGFQVYMAQLPDGKVLPLTYTPGNHIATGVLRDGRILFDAPHPTNQHDIYTVYSDGSGVETYRCDHSHPRYSGRELESGDIVFETAGRFGRFTSPRATEVATPNPATGEVAGPIAEIAPGDWLIAWRATAKAALGLYRFAGGSKTPQKIADNAVQPVVIRSYTPPKHHPSALGNREGANTLCTNVYTSKLKIPNGSVKFVRVWSQDETGHPIAMGRAPVEADGSFFVQIPADRPVRFELLDASGSPVAGEKGWFWMRRGEQRVCVGCHAGPERAAENATPEVLLHTTEPVNLTRPQRDSQ